MTLAERRDEVAEIIGRYPEKRAAVMPLLYVAQEQYGGWLPDEAIREVAAAIELDPTEVYAVAEFYSLYYRRPMGKYVIRFCTDMPCALVGAELAYEQLLGILEVEDGGTTEDGMFSVEQCVCLAACGSAPVALINLQFFETLTEASMRALIETIRESGLPEDGPALHFRPRTADTPTGL